MSNIVVARDTCVTTYEGQRVRLTRGQAWDADDGLVKAKPDLFTDDDRFINRTGPLPTKVERATRAPGEKRGR